MDKREKVIKGLEICKEDSKICFGESECGYQSYFPRCWITLAADALELLKAQEPRVMTLEEAYNAELVWYDQINTGVRPGKVIRVLNKTGVYRVMRFGDIDAWEHAYEYGEFWRCWTSRPTDEQREATPWKNEEEANT